MKRLKAYILAACIAAGMTGCGSTSNEPETALDVLSLYEQSAGYQNMHLTGGISVSTTVTTEDGIDIAMPMNMTVSQDIKGSSSHSLVNIDMSDGEQSYTSTVEAYATPDGNYTYDGDVWSVANSNEFDYSAYTNVPEDLFKNAELMSVSDEKGKIYTVTIPMHRIVSNKDSASIFGTLGLSGMLDGSEFIRAFENSYLTYTFDEDFNLTAIHMDAVSLDTMLVQNNTNYNMKVTINMNMAFKNFGNITDADVSAPESVKNSVTGNDGSSDEAVLITRPDNADEMFPDGGCLSVDKAKEQGLVNNGE